MIYSKLGFFLSSIRKILTLLFFALVYFCFTSFSLGLNIPQEYQQNYEIQEDRDKLLEVLIEIEAAQKVGSEMQEQQFSLLYNIFLKVFPYFPQSPEKKILYKQCELTTQTLSQEVNKNNYAIFKERCFSPLGSLIKEIQSKYTVKVDVVAKPKQGSVPLSVTFDARGSKDPSGDTIPSENFFWYYKDVYGEDRIIGKGPVINYIFEDPGNHVVHLTVRSVNNKTKGIFDGHESVAINVAPKSANIVVRINDRVLDKQSVFRLGTYEAKNGVRIDGTAISPIGSRVFTEHTRSISHKEKKYTFKKTIPGDPGELAHVFPYNGEYVLSIELKDNEGNIFREKYEIVVSDPVAIIRVRPESGTTSDEYVFDGSASYSLSSRVTKYQWIIRNPNGEEEIIENKKFKKNFFIPGDYFVKLTVVDEKGKKSYDDTILSVQSTPPIASFVINESLNWKYPSEFLLDASMSFDRDMTYQYDTLTYNWSIVPDRGVEMYPINGDESNMLLSFNYPGDYTITLRVHDQYGESHSLEKKLTVRSSLKPEIDIEPPVVHWGDSIQFNARVNKDVLFYERDFGDGTVQKTEKNQVVHKYQKSGVYVVKLRVFDDEDDQNEVSRQVFVGQKDMPVVAYHVKKNKNNILGKTAKCVSDEGKEVEAYEVDRYERFIFDASISRDTQGNSTNLSIVLHPKNDEAYSKPIIDYQFLELGCQYIDVFVEDVSRGKTSTERVWFLVQNALPVLDNFTLHFPQSSEKDVIGVGSTPFSSATRSMLENTSIDPVIVELRARGAKDPDGFISHYARYYYETKNPRNILALKITPASIPFTTFVISKPAYASEYSFAVRMIDNDGAEVTSEEILGKGPIIFFPPGENDLDVPIVSLRIDKGYAKVGEEIIFTTQSEVLSKNPDFEKHRYFKYDFDGDGEYDLTTKKSVVRYAYDSPGEKYPKVAVFYKGRAGVALGEKLLVQKGLRANIGVEVFDKRVIGRNLSVGDIEQSVLCFDITKCNEDESYTLEDPEVFSFTYDQYDEYTLTFDVLDVYGNEDKREKKISVQATGESDDIGIFSFPRANRTGDMYEIVVGDMLQNRIATMILSYGLKCFLDVNIVRDSDGNGDPSDDDDFSCNNVHDIAFDANVPEQYMRVYYAKDNKILRKDIRVLFLDFQQTFDEKYKSIVEDIKEVINILPSTGDEKILFIRTLLFNMQTSVGEYNEMQSLLLQLDQLLNENPQLLSREQREKLEYLMFSLRDDALDHSEGVNDVYEVAKRNILAFFDEDVRTDILTLFDQFESSEGLSPETRKTFLDDILRKSVQLKDKGVFDISDHHYIQKNLCDIVSYYSLPSKTCTDKENKNEIDEQSDKLVGGRKDKRDTSGSFFGNRVVKIIFIIIVVLGGAFVGLIIFFAIKSKVASHDDEDDEEDDDFEDDF